MSLPVLEFATLDSSRRALLKSRALDRLDDAAAVVAPVLERLRHGGDAAACAFLSDVDGVHLGPERLVVESDAVDRALVSVPDDLLTAMRRTVRNLERFCAAQITPDWQLEIEPGVVVGERFPAVGAAGLYVPHGKAVYPSSALMLTVPARIAGVERIVLSCGVDPAVGEIPAAVLAAAALGGATEIWRLSGTAAVAAFAWGTETLRPVDVIAGPGGRYVEAAKRLVRGVVGVDLDAGPSEVLVLALDDADPELVAADLLSEAEHGPDSSAVGVLTDPARAAAVVVALERRLSDLPAARQAYVRTQAADGRSALVVVPDAATAEAFAEEIASEHVVVHAADPEAVAGRLRRAGTVCVGPWSPSPVGSYVAGTNHVLPTGGSARHASGVSVDSFRRRQSFEHLTAEGLAAVRGDVGVYAAYEGLPAHRAAVEARFRTAADL